MNDGNVVVAAGWAADEGTNHHVRKGARYNIKHNPEINKSSIGGLCRTIDLEKPAKPCVSAADPSTQVCRTTGCGRGLAFGADLSQRFRSESIHSR